ncbi:hypothetical protein CONPUDRAFT_157724 [Coniophora puteana RWD-64-598 SS2]|uniref:Uncharacterized protein n=1 Tax=Coniophora puteana (strain RWD-64-598) TaxID=741705 RepID=A0A5M3MFT4_CONPW|nr:uncharacterized protein CONPUDRAFT_157724 [Coniophora puteana RWD-64-598 SS2]EIW77475.1 hypothetical protein CONPUDRAFT_157724 [Coniophora puteana RWD-64-598 SS2]
MDIHLALQMRGIDLEQELVQHIYDEIPIRLLSVSTGQLIDCEFVIAHFRDAVFENVLHVPHDLAEYDGGSDPPPFTECYKVHVRSVFQLTVAYAVLSHRWSRGETTYQGFINSLEPTEKVK